MNVERQSNYLGKAESAECKAVTQELSSIIPPGHFECISSPQVQPASTISLCPGELSTKEQSATSSTLLPVSGANDCIYSLSTLPVPLSVVPAIVHPVLNVSPAVTIRCSESQNSTVFTELCLPSLQDFQTSTQGTTSRNPVLNERRRIFDDDQSETEASLNKAIPKTNYVKKISKASLITENAVCPSEAVNIKCIDGSIPVSKDENFHHVQKSTACVPEAPSYLTAMAGKGSVALSWDPPKDNGGLQIDCYVVMVKMGGNKWQSVAQVNSNTTRYNVDNLKLETPYRFAVMAQNAIGRGPCIEVQNDVLLTGTKGKRII